MGLFLHGLQALGEHGDNLVEVAHDAEVGHLEDGGELVLVDGDDEFALLHAGEVLDGAADAAGHVEGGADGLAGLAHLAAGVYDASVDHGAAAADFAVGVGWRGRAYVGICSYFGRPAGAVR